LSALSLVIDKNRNIISIFLHGLGLLTCSGIDALPYFPFDPPISEAVRLCLWVLYFPLEGY